MKMHPAAAFISVTFALLATALGAYYVSRSYQPISSNRNSPNHSNYKNDTSTSTSKTWKSISCAAECSNNNERGPIYKLNCGHGFHIDCLFGLISTYNEACLVCSKEFDSKIVPEVIKSYMQRHPNHFRD